MRLLGFNLRVFLDGAEVLSVDKCTIRIRHRFREIRGKVSLGFILQKSNEADWGVEVTGYFDVGNNTNLPALLLNKSPLVVKFGTQNDDQGYFQGTALLTAYNGSAPNIIGARYSARFTGITALTYVPSHVLIYPGAESAQVIDLPISVVTGSDQAVIAAVASGSLSTPQPQVNIGRLITPAVEVVALTDLGPAIVTGDDLIFVASAESITGSTPVPGVFTGDTATPAVEPATLVDLAPQVNVGVGIFVNPELSSVTDLSPSIHIGKTVAAGVEAANISDVAPTTGGGVTVTPAVETITFNEPQASVLVSGAEVLAFSDAVGFGAKANGIINLGPWTLYESTQLAGDLPTLYEVTNLNDGGAGSFKDPLQNDADPRLVLINIDGAVSHSKTVITDDYWAVIKLNTGGGGFSLHGGELEVQGSFGFARNIRVRSGGAGGGDGIELIGTITHTIWDHVSISAATDENQASFGSSPGVGDPIVQYHTYQCIINAEGIGDNKAILVNGRRRANHFTGDRIYCVSNGIRIPRSSGRTDEGSVPNLINITYTGWYNFYSLNGGDKGIYAAGTYTNMRSALYEHGPDSRLTKIGATMAGAEISTGNIIPEATISTADHQTLFHGDDIITPTRPNNTFPQSDVIGPAIYDFTGDTLWSDPVTRFWSGTKLTDPVPDIEPTELGSGNLKADMTASWGCFPRDAVDSRVVDEANGIGTPSHKTVAELPSIASGVPLALDSVNKMTSAYLAANGLSAGVDYRAQKNPAGVYYNLDFANQSTESLIP